MRGTGRATPAAGLPEARQGVPAPGAGAFSGMHPRVRRPPESESEAVGAFAPDADEHTRALVQKLADAEHEIEAIRRERDELQQRLRAALDELAATRITARPPPESQAVDALASTIAVAPPRIDESDVAVIDGVAQEAPVAAPSYVPSAAPRSGSVRATSHGELSRLVVSTRPAAPSETVAPPSSGAERRQKERRECEFDVEFLGDSHFITGITQDLSEGGVFVATYQRLPLGTPVCLAFELPEGHRIEARGEVRWMRSEREETGTRPGLGIAFTELDRESLAKISEFCGSLPARYYEF